MVLRKGKVLKRSAFVIVNVLIALVLLVIPLTGCKFLTGEGIWQEPFSYVTPESQNISSEALQELTDIVQDYVDNEQIVGAELMVLKNRYIVLHDVFGWEDRENEVPMEENTLFNIRSIDQSQVITASPYFSRA